MREWDPTEVFEDLDAGRVPTPPAMFERWLPEDDYLAVLAGRRTWVQLAADDVTSIGLGALLVLRLVNDDARPLGDLPRPVLLRLVTDVHHDAESTVVIASLAPVELQWAGGAG